MRPLPPPYGGGRGGEAANFKNMKKIYFEPTMRVANLRHRYHLLQYSSGSKPSGNPWGDRSFGKFDGGDDEITDDDVDDII